MRPDNDCAIFVDDSDLHKDICGEHPYSAGDFSGDPSVGKLCLCLEQVSHYASVHQYIWGNDYFDYQSDSGLLPCGLCVCQAGISGKEFSLHDILKHDDDPLSDFPGAPL